MKTRITTLSILLAVLCGTASFAQENLNREILPIVTPEPATYSELSTKNTKPPAPFNVTAPKDAPNVVIILIDDLGLGATSAFGGPIRTPTLLLADRSELQRWKNLLAMVCVITTLILLHFVLLLEWR